MKNIIAKKIGMTTFINTDGNVVPVTILKVDKCWIVEKKEMENNIYKSIRVAFCPIEAKKANKSKLGLFRNVGNGQVGRYIREFRFSPEEDFVSYNIGDELSVSMFQEGDYVDVQGVSKGKGFAGVMKRHGFGGLPASHGNGEYRRATGAIGASSDPSRVFKGQRMPGRFGGNNVTVQKLEIVKVDPQENILAIKGAIPGVNGGYVKISETVKSLKKKKVVINTATKEVKLNKKR